MKIAIAGTRGIPACYGGFETFAEELSVRLVSRGHQVRVYGRSHVIKHKDRFYRGVEIKLLPTIRHKYLETPFHAFLTFLHLLFHRVDLVLVCNAANSPFVWILRLAAIPVVVNVDGIERRRAKWNLLGRLWYRLGEVSSVLFASEVVSDAQVICSYYKETYRRASTVIAYGHSTADGGTDALGEILTKKLVGEEVPGALAQREIFRELGISPNEYLLYVSRLERENNAHVVIQAYNALPEQVRTKPLLIVGDAPYAREYIVSLRTMASSGVIFAGFRFGLDYQALQLGAYLYVQATEVGGTHPALVEAMGYGNAIIANKTPENLEVLGEAGSFYEKNNSEALSALFLFYLSTPQAVFEFRNHARKRAQSLYNWEEITNKYEQLFRTLLRSVGESDQSSKAQNS